MKIAFTPLLLVLAVLVCGCTAAAPAAPAVTKILPTSGPIDGGTVVTITGTGLTGATAVTFGTTAATFVKVVNPTTITVVAPAHAEGVVNVTVTTKGGISATSNAGKFTYRAPKVTRISPSTGSTGGGTLVTITGTDLTEATAVTFGSSRGYITKNTETSITVIAPPHTKGFVNIQVITPRGTSSISNAGQFTYA